MNAGARFVIQQALADRRDFALLGATPALMQPRFGSLAPLGSGHRYIVGRGGLYVEARSKVLHAVACVAPTSHPLPFGEVGVFLQLPGGTLPSALVMHAVERAQAHCPQEWAGVIVHEQGGYRLVEPPVLSRSQGHVSYDRSGIDEEAVVCDLHSHGRAPAFFSDTDDADDRERGGFYLALVLGEVHAMRRSMAARLVLHGHFLPVQGLFLE